MRRRLRPRALKVLVVASVLALGGSVVLVLGSSGAIRTVLEDERGSQGSPGRPLAAAPLDPVDTIREGIERGLDGTPVQIRIRSPEAAPGISNDSQGPLFVETNMAPGTTTTRCVAVTNMGVQIGEVRVFGLIEDRGLAEHITFTIEAGEGAGSGDCSGFRGREIFRGSLAGLAQRHRDFASGVTAPDVVYPNESISFRLTQHLEGSSPQGVAATAQFVWESRGAGAPSPLRGGRDPLAYHAWDPSSTGAGDRDAALGKSVLRTILDTAIGIVKSGWSWALLVILVLVFLMVQRRIDARDPRLPRATAHQESDVPFEGRRPERSPEPEKASGASR